MTLGKFNGDRSKEVQLACRWNDDFEKGSEDHYNIQNPGIKEEISLVMIRLDEGPLVQRW